MAGQLEVLQQAFRSQNKSAFVVGYTGEIGKELVKALAKSKIFTRVVLIGRRNIAYEDEECKKMEQKLVDFDKLDEYADAFKDVDVGYCCLGTTRGKSGADGFYKVDHDYVVNTAKLAKAAGVSQLHVVSSQGANAKSSLLYTKTKGQVEDELKEMNFKSLYIYRPAMLLGDRTESRPMESIAKGLMKPIAWACPTWLTVPTATVAMAMVNKTVSAGAPEGDANVDELIDNKEIHRLGKCESDGKK